MDPVLLFQINPSSGVPIYRQLMDQVRTLIGAGRLTEGAMVPSVRQIAEGLQINPMTVSKAWSLLERDGVLERVRGQGMRVLAAAKPRATVKERQQALQPLLEQVVIQAAQLSLSREQVLAAMAAALKELPGE
jgi:GntR family transcriptional regulator